MELDEFVSQVLRQIVMGVKSAQGEVATHGAKVNPRLMTYGGKGEFDRETETAIQDIKFDVAVSTVEGTRTKSGIGIVIASVALGSQGQSEATNSSVSRIQFSVPLVLPPAK